MSRMTKKAMVDFHKKIEQLILGQTTSFCVYDITKNFLDGKTTMREYARISAHVKTVIGKLEYSGIIKFIKEEDGIAPKRKRLFRLVK